MPTTAPRITVMVDILEEHLEELAFLWIQRRAALRSHLHTQLSLAQLEERIEAHLEGLVVGGDAARPLLERGLASDDPATIFAAAFALLRISNGSCGADLVERIASAPPVIADALAEALAHAPTPPIDALKNVVRIGNRYAAAIAFRILAFHNRLDARDPDLGALLQDKSPAVRAIAWRALSLIGSATPAMASQTGWTDADKNVRCESLNAAAWCRHAPMLEHCRRMAASAAVDDLSALCSLAILGTPADLPAILKAGADASLGPGRFEILSSFGHPAVVELLLGAMTARDPAAAAAAGTAFTRITGIDVATGDRVKVGPEGSAPPDEFESEFLDEVILPDAKRARQQWESTKSNFAAANRWSGGLPVATFSADVLPQLDLGARWELCMRARYEGAWRGTLRELLRFPNDPAAIARGFQPDASTAPASATRR